MQAHQMQTLPEVQTAVPVARERKRHTTRHLASTRFAVPVGGGTYPRQGVPTLGGGGVPTLGTPLLWKVGIPRPDL